MTLYENRLRKRFRRVYNLSSIRKKYNYIANPGKNPQQLKKTFAAKHDKSDHRLKVLVLALSDSDYEIIELKW